MAEDKANSRFLRIIGILALVVLVALTVSLIALQHKLNQVLTQTAPPAAQNASISSEPVAAPAQVQEPEPAATKPAPKPSTASAPRRQTRQPETRTISLPEPPAPVAVVSSQPAPSLADASPQPTLALPPSSPTMVPSLVAEPRAESAFREVTVPSGTVVTIRLIRTLSSDQVRAGSRFSAVLDEPIVSSGGVVASRGSTVEGVVIASRKAGRASGVSEMILELDRLLLPDGRSLDLFTDALTRQGETSRGKDVATVGTGAAIGAAIGAIAGGGRGAAIGAATGAGAATTNVLLTRGEPVVLPPETRLSFQLRAPLRTDIKTAAASGINAESPQATSATRSGEEGRPRLRRR